MDGGMVVVDVKCGRTVGWRQGAEGVGHLVGKGERRPSSYSRHGQEVAVRGGKEAPSGLRGRGKWEGVRKQNVGGFAKAGLEGAWEEKNAGQKNADQNNAEV